MQHELQLQLKRKYHAFLPAHLDMEVGDGWHAVLDEQFGDLVAAVPIPANLVLVTAIRSQDGLCLVEYDAAPDADAELTHLFDNACSDIWHYSPLVCECCGRRSGVDGFLRYEPPRVRCDECDTCSS
ncbi:hypothetical protein [Rhizobium ruizarguesonis]|uniref:hypothetical protein n=1 Tax=Rhizobium ruizarguesonis TaxID=2081791 RepID=UPI00103099EC|nr:hypothetical protein [Rhizobium ruizarguesonis]TAT77158.1 hypothetical protein ELI56_02475 [Rhizobium ruizarguesonis]TBD19876.1 hypothetical protein ELH23_02440 [Rhizobium ruizarguesonis]